MNKFQYLVSYCLAEQNGEYDPEGALAVMLNAQGEEGWELVSCRWVGVDRSASGYECVLKRRIEAAQLQTRMVFGEQGESAEEAQQAEGFI